MSRRSVFFISDRTGISSESIGMALLQKFKGIDIHRENHPYIDTLDKALATVALIEHAYHTSKLRPLVFSTISNPEINHTIAQSPALHLDLFTPFLSKIEQELGIAPEQTVQKWELGKHYDQRMEAVNFALNHDDGSSAKNLEEADVILVGVSRCGKTPTCLYLAMQFGIRAANYPLTSDDLSDINLPTMIKNHKQKLYGLTIKPQRLQEIRQERFPNTDYASLKTCQSEIANAQAMFRRHGVPFMETTNKSVEELSVSIMEACHLKRRF